MFMFWVIVCGLAALAIAGYGGLRILIEPDMPLPIRALFGVVVLGVAGLVAWLPWGIASDDRWRQACGDAGGVVIVTGTHTTWVYSGKVLTPYTSSDYGCLKDGHLIEV